MSDLYGLKIRDRYGNIMLDTSNRITRYIDTVSIELSHVSPNFVASNIFQNIDKPFKYFVAITSIEGGGMFPLVPQYVSSVQGNDLLLKANLASLGNNTFKFTAHVGVY